MKPTKENALNSIWLFKPVEIYKIIEIYYSIQVCIFLKYKRLVSVKFFIEF